MPISVRHIPVLTTLRYANEAIRIVPNPQIVGNAGLYYCCYHLSLRGWNVMPTARNARGVDIIAYSADASCFVGIQVKTLSKRNPVPLGPTLDKCMGDFWIIVNEVTTSPAAFVLRPHEVRDLAHRGEKDGRITYWLQPIAYEQDRFRGAWTRIAPETVGAQQTNAARTPAPQAQDAS